MPAAADAHTLTRALARAGICFARSFGPRHTAIHPERSLDAHMTIPINCEETNLEVLARIAKAAARKFDCSIEIDFSNGQRRIAFVGDETRKAMIAAEMEYLFDAERALD
jgi:hypothetical protein